MRKGFETSILLYGPGVTLGVQRGFPTLGDEAFPGHQNFNKQLMTFMKEGGKIYACRFALQALYGHGEPSLIEGVIPISPLDVLDVILLHRKSNAFILDTMKSHYPVIIVGSTTTWRPSHRRCLKASKCSGSRAATDRAVSR